LIGKTKTFYADCTTINSSSGFEKVGFKIHQKFIYEEMKNDKGEIIFPKYKEFLKENDFPDTFNILRTVVLEVK